MRAYGVSCPFQASELEDGYTTKSVTHDPCLAAFFHEDKLSFFAKFYSFYTMLLKFLHFATTCHSKPNDISTKSLWPTSYIAG